jgi:hypothetical protein
MLYCDNNVAINIANNPIQHDKTKHVETDRYFIKDKLDNDIVYAFCRNQGTNCGCFHKGVGYHRLVQCNRQDEHDKYLCIILRGSVEYYIFIVRIFR